MRWVDKPYRRPGRCLLVPYRGQMTPGRWLEVGQLGPPGFEEQGYLHEQSARDLAAFIGWHAPAELKALQVQVRDLEARLAVAVGERDEARGVLGHIDAIESEGFRARRKPGRPAKEAVT